MLGLFRTLREPERYLHLLGTIFCLLYGLLLIALIHTTADGSWFWYAADLRQGTRLYADLHLALQPLYAVELAVFQHWFGIGWLAGQLPACANLLLLTGSLLLVTRWVPLRTAWHTLLLCCSFSVVMGFIMMRFDDYHVLSASLELLSAATLLRLTQPAGTRLRLFLMAGLGVLCGFCMLNRLNDGCLLLAAALMVVACLPLEGNGSYRGRYAVAGVGLLLVIVALTIVAMLHALHERIADWKLYSITRAAAIKGGTGQLFLYPFRLPWGTLHELLGGGWRFFMVLGYILVVAAVVGFGSERLKNVSSPRKRRHVALVMAALVIVLTMPLHRQISHGNVGRVVVALSVFAIYAASATVLYRLVLQSSGRGRPGWSSRELVVLLPLGQLISISMSAARWYPNTYPAAAVFLLLLPIGLPWWFVSRRLRAAWVSLIALLFVSVTVDKIRDPFDWFNYRSRSLDAPRAWITHPLYGRMWMQRDQMALFDPVCQQVGASTELLSLPFTYANYFCGIAPWHGYVQSFYDTSSRQAIKTLADELRTHPPEWILYQRQLDVLAENERAFNGGKPLPQRDLDTLILQQVQLGRWTASKQQAPFRDTSTWMLIHTRPETR